MKRLRILASSIVAGIAIAIGGMVYLSASYADEKIIGAYGFSVALLVICVFGLTLYTGKVGYVFENRKGFIIDLLIMWLGNMAGATGAGYAIRATRLMSNSFETLAVTVSSAKINDSFLSLLILGVFCGMLVFFAVDVFKRGEQPAIKVAVLILAIGGFVVVGFEHVIADMFYFALANTWQTDFWKTGLALLSVTIGNSMGAWIVWGTLKLFNLKKDDKFDRKA